MTRLDRPAMLITGLVSLVLGLVFLLYHHFGVTDVGYDIKDTTHSAFRWLYERWHVDLHQTWYAHSHIIPLISLWLVWRDRRALARIPRQVFYPGIGVIVLALALHWAGAKSQQTRLTVLSMMVLAWGLPLFVCGWPMAKRLLFPCGFLIFSLPLNFFDAAAYPLRLIAAAFTTGVSNGLGLEVSRVGGVIIFDKLEGISFNLADSRSGIFAVTGIIAYAVLVGYLARMTPLRRILLIAMSIPLLVLANIVRGLIGIITATVAGGAAGTTLFNILSGPAIVVLAFGGITAFGWRWREPAHDTPLFNPAPAAASSAPSALAISALLLALAIWWIPTNLTITHEDAAGVNLDLPAGIGAWSGGMLLFCHNPADAGEQVAPDLGPGDPCPTCGQPLHEMTLVERSLLPPDTTVRKNRYTSDQNKMLYLSIVLSGKDRSSIHRPEVCLVGPNSQINNTLFHTVRLQDGSNLKVKVLEMVYTVPDRQGQTRSVATYYAYWFAGINRETPSHYQRMWWMARDRLFRNRSYRWAYISVAGARMTPGREYLTEMDSFIRDAYPVLHRPADRTVVED